MQTSVRLSRLARQATAGFATELTPLHDHLALTRVKSTIHIRPDHYPVRRAEGYILKIHVAQLDLWPTLTLLSTIIEFYGHVLICRVSAS